MTLPETLPIDLQPVSAPLAGPRPLRIALLGYRSHPYVGGQGIYIRYLSKALVELGHQVDVLSGPPYPELDPRVRLIKIPSLDLFAADNHITALRWQHLRSWSDFFEWWSMLTGGFAEPYTFCRRVVKYLRQHRDDYDLVHDNQSLGYGLLQLQRLGIPVLATVHHPITRDLRLALEAAPNWKHRLLVRRWHSFLAMQQTVVKRLRHVVTVSKQSRGDIAVEFGRPLRSIALIHNGIDTDTFCPLADVAVNPLRIMTTASADQPLKGLRFLLQAIAELVPRYPELELLVVGKLKEGGQTDLLLRQLGIAHRVAFVSGISTDELVRLYNEAAVAVSPSLYEGFGLPAAEAMACGCAVVSSDGGALPEVVGDAGVVVPAGDSHALAAALDQLLANPAERQALGRKGRARILQRFCWSVCASQFVDYYRRMLTESVGAEARTTEARTTEEQGREAVCKP